ncbi:redoxin domain-containing protein [Micromonospora sp. NBC_01796]|uniref:redoxin domain-containing protein n=1 Tax=Micromonospora sp. NBC_01796 TaxID=2975987 RepID=UPI002DD7E512|nr:redoxin domain-containing protein [Micromonospora sp. NBC_01796]WSA83132.1 redoxin domain-containing protein [Micromonospora sp. NBC_01796]
MTDPSGALQPGQPAPEFTLPAGLDRRVSLADSRGRPTVLAFYPADWSPVCGDQMALYQAARPAFDQYDATLLGISVDSVWCHKAFAASAGIEFPLLSDFEPKGAVARRYGVYGPDGYAERALFVLDTRAQVSWSYVSPTDVNPGADGILDALDALTSRQQARA